MCFAHIAGFYKDTGTHPEFMPDEVVVHGAHCQQRRNWRPVFAHFPVGKNENVHPIANSALCLHAQVVDGRFECIVAAVGIESDVECL